jgi:hypothetical protein
VQQVLVGAERMAALGELRKRSGIERTGSFWEIAGVVGITGMRAQSGLFAVRAEMSVKSNLVSEINWKLKTAT